MKRSPHLVPYDLVDERIKQANRDTASQIIRTVMMYGYTIEPPNVEQDDRKCSFKLKSKVGLDQYHREKYLKLSCFRYDERKRSSQTEHENVQRREKLLGHHWQMVLRIRNSNTWVHESGMDGCGCNSRHRFGLRRNFLRLRWIFGQKVASRTRTIRKIMERWRRRWMLPGFER